MSEIGEKAEKIWREKSAIIVQRKKELTAIQTYANRILDVFEASDEQCCVLTVIISYDPYQKCLNCHVQLFDDIDGETNEHIFVIVDNKKVMEAMNNVNACQASDCGIITRIYNLLATDLQVTKYFEVTLDEHSAIIIIKMRSENEVTLN